MKYLNLDYTKFNFYTMSGYQKIFSILGLLNVVELLYGRYFLNKINIWNIIVLVLMLIAFNIEGRL